MKFATKATTVAGCLAICAAGVLAMFKLRSINRPVHTIDFKLGVTPDILDIGRITTLTNNISEVQLSNQTPATAALMAIRSSCSCVDIEPRSFQIAPGQSMKLPVHYSAGEQPLSRIHEAVALELAWSSGGKSWTEIQVTGQVISDALIHVFPSTIDLGRVRSGSFVRTIWVRAAAQLCEQLPSKISVPGCRKIELSETAGSAAEIQRSVVISVEVSSTPIGRFDFPIAISVKDHEGHVVVTQIQICGTIV